jgi:hypothetical protein
MASQSHEVTSCRNTGPQHNVRRPKAARQSRNTWRLKLATVRRCRQQKTSRIAISIVDEFEGSLKIGRLGQ